MIPSKFPLEQLPLITPIFKVIGNTSSHNYPMGALITGLNMESLIRNYNPEHYNTITQNRCKLLDLSGCSAEDQARYKDRVFNGNNIHTRDMELVGYMNPKKNGNELLASILELPKNTVILEHEESLKEKGLYSFMGEEASILAINLKTGEVTCSALLEKQLKTAGLVGKALSIPEINAKDYNSRYNYTPKIYLVLDKECPEKLSVDSESLKIFVKNKAGLKICGKYMFIKFSERFHENESLPLGKVLCIEGVSSGITSKQLELFEKYSAFEMPLGEVKKEDIFKQPSKGGSKTSKKYPKAPVREREDIPIREVTEAPLAEAIEAMFAERQNQTQTHTNLGGGLRFEIRNGAGLATTGTLPVTSDVTWPRDLPDPVPFSGSMLTPGDRLAGEGRIANYLGYFGTSIRDIAHDSIRTLVSRVFNADFIAERHRTYFAMLRPDLVNTYPAKIISSVINSRSENTTLFERFDMLNGKTFGEIVEEYFGGQWPSF